MAAVIKDVGEIWTRLFDHRPFLSGEIKFFLKEFEEKRADREVERLFQILERATEIKETQLDRVKLASDVHLPTLNANLEVAVSMCNRILEKEEEHRSDTALLAKREIRKAEWESFIEDMTQKCSKVDATFEEKEEELREFYSDLEKKLHIGK
ncbi:biogenesis of lysosome-related organelles complex 1 subunit 5 [Periplaneta americana]|uniref:biogenesis of lysosome-related organelles complex 1 subunit 5 n=1 Tax=Periplaneta americana TaxID=6978 RepID=UPI0037E9A3CB